MHSITEKSKEISVAPMMDWTDRHCRYFHRLIAPHVVLYTEMVTTGALIHGDRPRFLRFDQSEHPIALQLGGSDPDALSRCAKMAEDFGYDEVNLNCGCPSDRVQSGAFGACLMAEPEKVGECIKTMQNAVQIPVTVKCRIGIDDCDEEVFLREFIRIVSEAGCQKFIIHARKAWLKGLSPKENRDIPPLNYDLVKQIKEENPDLTIILNGGLACGDQIKEHIEALDGAMIGREAYKNPYFLAEIEEIFFNNCEIRDAKEIIEAMQTYANRQYQDYQTPIKSIARHMLGLFQGQKGAKAWRQYLSQNMHLRDHQPLLLHEAFDAMQQR